MAHKELTSLPSMLTDGKNTEAFDLLSDEERSKAIQSICLTISSRMSDYYTLNPEAWKKFLKTDFQSFLQS